MLTMLSYLWNDYGVWTNEKQSNKQNISISTRQHMAESC